MKRWLLLYALTFWGCGIAWAEIETKTVEYKQGDTRLMGSLAYAKDQQIPRPGIAAVLC